MALAAKLQLRQSQSLVMTPQLMQSIRLLQFTHVELERFIDDEIERNPLLERAEPQDDAASDQAQKVDAAPEAAGDWFETDTAWSAEAISEKLDTSLENLFPDDPGTSERLGPDLTAQWKSASGNGSSSSSSEGFDAADIAAAAITLRDHVGEQVALAFGDPAARLIAGELADGLDEAGYMRADMAEIAVRLGTNEAAVAKVLAVCQAFEPAGIFARDLAECLALQLAVRDRLDPAMKALIANLELLARRDFQTLKRICGVDEEDLLDMLAEIRALDPRPGMAFSGGASDAIVADVEVRAANDGSWTVELNAETLPRVLVDHIYFAQVSPHAKKPDGKGFPGRVPAERQLADAQPRPAGKDHPQGCFRDRAPAGRFPRAWRAASEAAQFAHGGRRHRHARIDRQPGHGEQIHADAAWRVRTALFLHRLDRVVGRRRCAFVGSGARSHQAADRRGETRRRAFRRCDCGHVAGKRRRYRQAHGRQVPGRHEHSLVGATAARKTRAGQRRALVSQPDFHSFRASLTSCNEVARSPPA
ncbi:hypothetical protein MESS2_1540031 [Mesorhizobium metallidurans STM 2683]|uniref:RNA polymerase sigma factor 54 core-binding domain-containing protein n=1 Tax=Mesorhizobium metallidurans STM 2683 TaxID=1297569 RepID=M5F0K2_9HYPH|nr:hypothetical protein MESS2_1540031 [Mesorhizobium metallidurans STM 2683]